MIEALSKYYSLIFFINISCIIFADNIDTDPTSYSYLYNNYAPYDLTNNNIGIQFSTIGNKKSFLTQHWITNNLYVGGVLGPELNDKIDIAYGLNIGYKTKIKYFDMKGIIFDFSFYKNELLSDYSSCENKTCENKWKKLGIFLNFNNFSSISMNYIFSNCNQWDIDNDINGCDNLNDNKNSHYITFDLFQIINNNYFFNFGIKKSKVKMYPYLTIRYNI